MRASDTYTESLFTMSTLEDFIPQSHPLRPIRKMVNEALAHLEGFLTSMYAAQSQGGRPAIALCFLALVLHRGMRLRKAEAGLSPASSLGVLRQIQHQRISLNGTRVVRGLSKINDLQSRVLRALGVPTPDINSIDRQLELGL
jgi:hypothetical protein